MTTVSLLPVMLSGSLPSILVGDSMVMFQNGSVFEYIHVLYTNFELNLMLVT